MRYLSVCSGIEAATVAWHGLGWTPVGFSEIEPFPSAVLAHHYPNVPNFGDMTKHEQWTLQPGSIDLLVAGTPCQSFSVAGLRQGLKDPRGNLMLTYLAIAARLRPQWVVWENVPGVLSSNGGRDFGSFLGALGELGYGWAYRVLDAQWCRTHGHPRAVPQRRRRVFVVGCLGDWTRAAQVLFERESVQRDSSPRRTPGQGASADAEGGARGGCWWDGTDCAGTLTKQNAGGAQRMPDKDNFGAIIQPTTVRSSSIGAFVQDDVGGTMRANGGDYHGGSESLVMWPAEVAAHAAVVNMQGSKSNACVSTDGTSFTLNAMHGHDVYAVAVAHASYSTGGTHGVNQHPEVSPAVKVGSGLGIPSPPAVAHSLRADGFDASEDGTGRGTPLVPQAMTVRRLTARECERLQAFPDDYTLIPWRKKQAEDCPDGPRYKALGNSMAVNCMAWIGERIAALENNR